MEIGSIGTPAFSGRPGAREDLAEAQGRGRAAAPGQEAKSVVAAAREAQVELPQNAQGIAASSIARGVDPATLFRAQVPEAGGAEDSAAVQDPVDSATADPALSVTAEPELDPAAETVETSDAAPATSAEGREAPTSDTSPVAEQATPPEDPAPAPAEATAENAVLAQYQAAAQFVSTVTPAEQGAEAGLNRTL